MTYTNENFGVAGFTMIPNELIENMELNGSLLPTMIALYRFKNNQNNSCFPSYQTLSKYARCSRRYVISNMKKLEDMKLVKVSRHDKDEKNAHSSNVYTLLSPSKKQSDSKSSQDDLEAERIVESKDKKRLENQSIVSSKLTSLPSELISPELYLSNKTKSK